MKKTTVLLIAVLFMVIGYAAYNATINIYGNALLAENLSDFKVYLSNLKVNGTEVEGISDAKDEFTVEDINGNISVDIVNDSTEYDTEAYLDCDVNQSWSFDYTGAVQTFTAPVTGIYKLETWGAAGGGAQAGFGGYSTGNVTLSANEQIFIVVGSAGSISTNGNNGGGYNGGGNGSNVSQTGSGGGGATHIAKTNRGLLSSYSSYINELLIVSGGGGGSTSTIHDNYGVGGSGGGYLGVTGGYLNQLNWSFYGTGGSQTTGGVCYLYDTNLADSGSYGTFGKGGNHGYESSSNVGGSGGGGGLYGGGGSSRGHGQAGGGSGYIGNSLLSEKVMYCYNCAESSDDSIKTVKTSCGNSEPTANCAKSGNGYARITLTSAQSAITTDKVTITAQESSNQNIKNVTSKTMTCKLKVNKVSRTERIYNGPTEWTFDYTGGEQIFTAPIKGNYKLEVWGAQGGTDSTSYYGGYGGYSSGVISLGNDNKIYVYVGEKGKNLSSSTSGLVYAYPNSGNLRITTPDSYNIDFSSGGGSTHIVSESGNLSQFSLKLNNILIVAGGGGGACTWWLADNGGSGGGYIGATTTKNYSNGTITNNNPTGGTQSVGGYGGGNLSGNSKESWLNGIFGVGGGSSTTKESASASGGGGFYGGGASWGGSAAGGSGYIGNSLLSEKSMYCYNCEESSEESTKTISTTCTSTTPTANCAKQGNGYAKITLISN